MTYTYSLPHTHTNKHRHLQRTPMSRLSNTPLAAAFIDVTYTAPAVFGGDGPRRNESVGHGTFASYNIPAGAILQGTGGRVPFNLQLFRAGRQVRARNPRLAYNLAGDDAIFYFLNCCDPPEYHEEFPDYALANVEFSEFKQGRDWRFALKVTRTIPAGQQLLVPLYF